MGGGHLVMAVGLIGSEDPADPLFMDLKGRNLLRVLHFLTLKTGLKGLLKSLWTLLSMCLHGTFWWYSYLRKFSATDTRVSEIQGDWCIYGIHAIYSCLLVLESHINGDGPS